MMWNQTGDGGVGFDLLSTNCRTSLGRRRGTRAEATYLGRIALTKLCRGGGSTPPPPLDCSVRTRYTRRGGAE